jgi:hypothetical protein
VALAQSRPAGQDPFDRLVAHSRPAASAYDALDDSKLAATLQELQMHELLLELSKTSAKPAVERLGWGARALLVMAAQQADREAAEALIDQAIAQYDRLIELTKEQRGYPGQVLHFHYLMQRMVAEGLLKAEPYAQRVLYLLDNPSDKQKVLRLADSALGVGGRLEQLLSDAQGKWYADEESKISGAYFEVKGLLLELRYRQGWLHFYKAISMPIKGSAAEDRKDLFQQVVSDLEEFASSEQADTNVRCWARLLSGMATRELGRYDTADKLLKPLTQEDTPKDIRLKALFELARLAIEEGKSDAAQAAIENFHAQAAKVTGLAPIAVEMQTTLLKSYSYTLQARAVAASNPQLAAELNRKSGLVLLVFLKDYPEHIRAFASSVGPRYECQDPDKLSPELAVLVGIAKSFDNSTKSQEQAERAFLSVLKNKDQKDATPSVMAMGYLGRLYLLRKDYLAAASSFRRLAENFPKESLAKSAAWEAVRAMETVINDPNAKPGEREHAEYLLCLEVLTAHWSGDANVKTRYYPLGLEYDRVSRRNDAIKAFEAVGPEAGAYLPSRMRALSLRGQAMLESSRPSIPAAQVLVSDIRQFHQSAIAFRSPDADRLDLARRMGAQMDLLAAQLQLDVLALPKDARAMAEQAAKDWSAVPGMNDHYLRVMIQTYLKEQNLAKAIELFDKIQQGAEDVVGQIVVQVRQRIESLDPVKDAEELKQYLDNYVRFAEMLHATADSRFKANAAGKPANWLDKQMYAYRQILACAYEYSDDPERLAKALELYRTLAKQNKQDAVNLRGMARCNRKLKANIEAMNQYNALVAGLEKRSPAWWKAQLERIQFAVQVSASSPEEMKKVALELKVLQDVDRQMGGLASEFPRLDATTRAVP